MATTTNYGLYLNDDSSETFLSWRNKINGTEDSNMIMIDIALDDISTSVANVETGLDTLEAGKAATSTSISATLSASSWVGSDAPYTQDIAITGLSADTNGVISVSQGASADAREAARNALLSVYGQSDGVLSIYADGDLPEVDIPVTVIVLG